MFSAAFDPVFVWGNYAEAALWIGLGGAALAFGKTRARVPLAFALIAFGLSDLVETRTGAWYQPWWLLAWKIACVILIVGLGFNELRALRRKSS